MWSRSRALVWWRPSIAGASGRMRKCAVITLCMWTSPTGTTTSNKSSCVSLRKKVRDLLHFLRLLTHNFWNYGSFWSKLDKQNHKTCTQHAKHYVSLLQNTYISTLTQASNDWPYTHQTTCFGLWVNCFTECASSTSVWEMIY